MSYHEAGLEKRPANYAALTPLGFLERSATVYPDVTSVIDGLQKYTWIQTYRRCRQLAGALQRRGIGRGCTVSFLAPNIPPLFEAHFGVPMAGAVLNAINTRLDARTVAHILHHARATVVFVDHELAPLLKDALAILCGKQPPVAPPFVIVCKDPLRGSDATDPGGEARDISDLRATDYEAFLQEGDPEFVWEPPADEWDTIALNYTSGTTASPKGVMCHHRGAYLAALSNVMTWGMPARPVYLWTLPMFHCNGWCFPWTLAALAGTSVCLRQVTAGAVFNAIATYGVTHMCGAPIVLNLLANAPESERRPLPSGGVAVMTAGAAPPPTVLEAAEAQGFRVTHTYGLTETYGPAVVCAWRGDLWDGLPLEERARLNARQGVRYLGLEGLDVLDPSTMQPVPCDGHTLGEVMMRGNMVMRGYLANTGATAEALAGGWFHSGDLGVRHADGYVELRDRAKDIIISGGENISSIEVEAALYRHPAVLEAAVVAKPDEKWGEVPCAFVTLKEGRQAQANEILAFCRRELPHFMAPRYVVFGPLPKTSTGKVQKFELREKVKSLGPSPRPRL